MKKAPAPVASIQPLVRSKEDRSVSTKKTWANKTVAAKRATRTAVIVQGHGEFSSVSKAFNALNLPQSGRIRFRMALKAAGTKSFSYEGTVYTFSVVPRKGGDQ